MRVFPAVHYSMGGLWVDFERAANGWLVEGSPRNQATNIQGLYAAGEVDYQYHGANRLGANSLLSCIYGGHGHGPGDGDLPQEPRAKRLGHAERRCSRRPSGASAKKYEAILKMDGDENPYKLHEELGRT